MTGAEAATGFPGAPLEPAGWEAARRSRDPRFDGRFFVAVVTTGIYCRPICPARPPAPDNVRLFPSAPAAEAAGYRPCLRCCPELAPPGPPTAGLVGRALRAIDGGALDDGTIADLAAALGVSARHLNRVLRDATGATIGHFARSRRLHAAKRLICGTSLPFTEVAQLAGYRSLRRFNAAVTDCWQRSPSALRALPRSPLDRGDPLELNLHLPVSAPWDGRWMGDFLARRAVHGLEKADSQSYARGMVQQGSWGRVEVRWPADPVTRVALRMTGFPIGAVPAVISGVRALLDLDAAPAAVAAALGQDPMLAPALQRWPGIRVPGTLDEFELAVRAVLGQQVSVSAARTLTTRLVTSLGTRVGSGDYRFPEPAVLATTDIAAAVGMPATRANAIRGLGEGVAAGRIDLRSGDAAALAQQLEAVRGIGPWTAQYVAMRAARDPDAFIDGDLIVRRVLGFGTRTARREVLARAAGWRPFRAYAVMLLWRMATAAVD